MAETSESGTILARTAAGAGWVIGWRMATRLLGLVNTLILVRLLLPKDFGLVSLGWTFGQVIDALSTLGVEYAIMRERAPDRTFYDTGFTINVLRGLGSALIIALAAFPAGGFFGEPRLTNVLLAIAVVLLINGFENIGTVDFQRDLAFQKEFVLLVLPRIAGIAVTVLTALALRNYWALVAGIAANNIFKIALGYFMHPFRPRFSLGAWRHLAGFSMWTWMIGIATMIRDRSDNMIIGRMLSATQVGLYALGTEIGTLPSTELVLPLARACFPGFAAVKHAGDSTAGTYLRVVATMALLTLPAGIGIALVADPVTRLAFGPRWLDAIPLIRIMGVIGALTVFGHISMTLFSVYALLDAMFYITVIATILRIALMIFLIGKFGVIGAAVAVAIAGLVEQAIYVSMTLRRFRLGIGALFRQTWRTLAATGAMACVLLATGLGGGILGGNWVQAERLSVAVLLGAATYTGVLFALWFASGRPAGAETDLLALGVRGGGAFAARLRRLSLSILVRPRQF